MFLSKNFKVVFLIIAGIYAGESASSNSTTFQVCEKTPEKVELNLVGTDPPSTYSKERFRILDAFERNNCTEILRSSNLPARSYISPHLGFVNTVVKCYNDHHNIIIRPDDIWAAIMTQFSLYVNKNAEKFRRKFVAHEGQKQLTVTVPGSLRRAPYNILIQKMSQEIHKNLVDPVVKKWVLPSFSTTTDTDLVTVGVVFMATMKKYFSYQFSLMCGVPSITLEGTVQDWRDIYKRLNKLKVYELRKWQRMLKPILKEFVNAKKGKANLDFWQRMVHYRHAGSGTDYVSGWITAFSVFDSEGNWQGKGKEMWKCADISLLLVFFAMCPVVLYL